MARFSDNEIAKLKQSIPLVALLQKQGFDLKKHGKDYVCHCPFHDDKTPSLVVSPDKNLWHCLGRCGTGGSVIDWMMQLEKVGFRKAAEMLMDEYPPFTQSIRSALGAGSVAKPVEPVKSKPARDTQELLHRVVAHYQERLLASESARSYLEKRGLNNDELIGHFKIGFCDRKINQILSSRPSVRGKAQRLALKETGIVLDNGIERMNGSIVVPVINHNHVLEMYGRKINDVKLRKGVAKHLYLPGPHKGVWNLEGICGQQSIILCESLIDAMSLWVHGFKNVTTSYGIHGFTEELLAVIQLEKIDNVLIAYDRDEAGDKAANALIAKLCKEKIKAARLKLPRKTDINEWALKTDNFSEEFKECVLSAMSIFTQSTHCVRGAGSAAKTAASEEQARPEVKKDEPQIEAKTNGGDILIERGNRHYRIRGLDKNKSHEQLKINLMLKKADLFFIDALDLYQAKPRSLFIKQASIECGIEERLIKSDLGRILLKLESIQEEKCQALEHEKAVELTVAETEQALALLSDKNLLNRILHDFHGCGVVGEETNKLVGYLACVSRKLDKPLAIIIQSTSAAGKSSLMDAVLNMIPEEEKTQYSAMTGQSLYYLGQTSLKHKILAIAEEEGAAQASYALKLLQSEGAINIASTGKNASTGDLETQVYHVEGPVMLFMTTTAIDIDEELLNRCLVLTVNESQRQTQAIHVQQRFADTLEGLLSQATKNKIMALHHNAQRLLKPLKVVNPFAAQLSFLSNKTRTRRDHQKYLTLIKSITLLHQYQREIKSVSHDGEVIQYIEVTMADIDTANRLAHEVLGRTLDELPPQTRCLLQQIYDYVQQQIKEQQVEQKDFLFSRRDIREMSGWGLTQIATHCQRLEAMEYLIIHSGKRGQLLKYSLSYEGQGSSGQAFMLGLCNHKAEHMVPELSGVKPKLPESKRGQIGGVSGSNRGKKNSAKLNDGVGLDSLCAEVMIKSTTGDKKSIHQVGAH